jgi:hypothetical protein
VCWPPSVSMDETGADEPQGGLFLDRRQRVPYVWLIGPAVCVDMRGVTSEGAPLPGGFPPGFGAEWRR